MNTSRPPAIILIEPQLPENIGMVARAMANFNLTDLRLVNPREPFFTEKCYATASKANFIIDDALIFKNLPDAVADLNFIYATTARERDNFKPVNSPATAMQAARNLSAANQKIGILFGRERFGLNNDEVSLADQIITFPVNREFSSLNLAQSVLLLSYEWNKAGLLGEEQTNFQGPEFEQASKASLYSLFSHLEHALEVRGYFRSASKKQAMLENLRDVLTRASFSEAEIRLLRGVIASFDRFSPSVPRGVGSLKPRSSKSSQSSQS